MQICGVLERVLRGAGESYLGLSKVVVVSSIEGDTWKVKPQLYLRD